jgi:hypothetical protein
MGSLQAWWPISCLSNPDLGGAGGGRLSFPRNSPNSRRYSPRPVTQLVVRQAAFIIVCGYCPYRGSNHTR